MDITLNIPVTVPSSAFSVSELRAALEEYALIWVSKAKAKEPQTVDEFELPAKFEKLCGCISEDKVRSLAAIDDRINHIISD